jgi:hypothetical protein
MTVQKIEYFDPFKEEIITRAASLSAKGTRALILTWPFVWR